MHFDPLARKEQERNFMVWFQSLLQKEPEQIACQLAGKHRPGNGLTAVRWRTGGYNVTFRVKYDDGFQAIVRFAALGQSLYRTEKVENEAIVLQYLRKNTNIPVPRLLGVGKITLGPYIVEEFIEGDLGSGPFMESRIELQNLNPNISEQKLKVLYREMANIVLEMSKPEFTRIGSLVQTGNGYSIGRRPLTKYMNELAMKANLGPQHFPTSMYTTSAAYFESLVQQHMAQLRNQRNDCVKDEHDYKEKYIARCLFLRIARHIAKEHSTGSFRLFCEDLRPSNVIANTEPFHVNAVIDLEFTYAAPAAFTYAAPWWLLLQNPEQWELDLKGAFLPRYTPRLGLFLEALREVEEEQIKSERLLEAQKLSERMEQSMENGLFWFCLAIRNSQMFDDIYWTFLDEMYFGPLGKLEDRIQFLNEEERNELSTLYEIKQEQAKDATLDSVYDVGDQLDY
ncbi:hypothetical protein NHQ30_006189 [Ciborinia camelliae]|nr:hypothetical protein NHQ30_006189 [Ciborinia camelliae]